MNAPNSRDFWVLELSAEQMGRPKVEEIERLVQVGCDDRFADQVDLFGSDLDNREELRAAEFTLSSALPMTYEGEPLLPADFPIPRLRLASDIAYDYVEGDYRFVSRRMRDALDQPPQILQYWPIELLEGSDAAYAQDYKLMRILRAQPVMDLSRSRFTTSEGVREDTGERKTYYAIREMVLRDDLPSWPQIFGASEKSSWSLVIDALAQRVMAAGCTGVSFRDPHALSMRGRLPQRLRTATGIEVKDLNLRAS